ncbi:hypothetical protein KW782_02680 [Candidatus Parcubacteria bacterium]|nr:hypothetical protein [Candidatus Parcubacteria bacterium]
MKILIDTYKNTGDIHHAYVLEGQAENIRDELFDFFKKHLKVSVTGNPDFWHSQYDTFAVDDARALREAQANKSLAGGRKIFVIETRGMTVEAQNSLLKVLEEPTAGTHIFIIIPSAEIILPTLRSRANVVSYREKGDENHEAKTFLKATIPERLEMVSDIIEEKDKAGAAVLLDGLIYELHAKPGNEKALKEILNSRMYINDRSPSLKLLLEHIACVLP